MAIVTVRDRIGRENFCIRISTLREEEATGAFGVKAAAFSIVFPGSSLRDAPSDEERCAAHPFGRGRNRRVQAEINCLMGVMI